MTFPKKKIKVRRDGDLVGKVPFQIIPASSSPHEKSAAYVLVFKADKIPPLGISTYRVYEGEDTIAADDAERVKQLSESQGKENYNPNKVTLNNRDDAISISNGLVRIEISKRTGRITKMANDKQDIEVWIGQDGIGGKLIEKSYSNLQRMIREFSYRYRFL